METCAICGRKCERRDMFKLALFGKEQYAAIACLHCFCVCAKLLADRLAEDDTRLAGPTTR